MYKYLAYSQGVVTAAAWNLESISIGGSTWEGTIWHNNFTMTIASGGMKIATGSLLVATSIFASDEYYKNVLLAYDMVSIGAMFGKFFASPPPKTWSGIYDDIKEHTHHSSIYMRTEVIDNADATLTLIESVPRTGVILYSIIEFLEASSLKLISIGIHNYCKPNIDNDLLASSNIIEEVDMIGSINEF